jgi:hypothetical protein
MSNEHAFFVCSGCGQSLQPTVVVIEHRCPRCTLASHLFAEIDEYISENPTSYPDGIGAIEDVLKYFRQREGKELDNHDFYKFLQL